MITLISSGRGTGRAGANGASTISELAMPPRPSIALALHRLLLRTALSPAGRFWTLAYRLTALAVAAHLLRGQRGGEAYGRGSFESDDFLPGLSDVDLVVVFAPDPAGPGVAGARVRARWER